MRFNEHDHSHETFANKLQLRSNAAAAEVATTTAVLFSRHQLMSLSILMDIFVSNQKIHYQRNSYTQLYDVRIFLMP